MSSRHLTEYNTLRDNGMLYTRTAPGLGEGPGPPTKRGPPSCPYVLPYMRHVRATYPFLSRKACLSLGKTAVFHLNIIWYCDETNTFLFPGSRPGIWICECQAT